MKRKLNVKLISIFAVALILVSVMSFMAFASDGNGKAPVMVFHTTEVEKAIEILKSEGVKVVDEADL